MDYISVKEAAEKFELSERRVQKLCESSRIEGCNMVSGVWLIPSEAGKPSDKRLATIPNDTDCLSLKEICDKLSISTATGRNWIKLGKLKPKYTENATPYFTKDYAKILKNEIKSGKNRSLKSRRNKKFVSGNALYNSYVSEQSKNILVIQKLLEIIDKDKIKLNLDVIQYIIADCALHLFAEKLQLPCQKQQNLLFRYLKREITLGNYNSLIDSLIPHTESAIQFSESHHLLFTMEYVLESNEDILGLIYISCKNIGNRKATGSYYTSAKIVKKLISKLNITESSSVLDPCCGTGNFLLQLPEEIPFNNIYGNDIDSISVKITRLNIALKFPNASVDDICHHITEMNYLTEYPEGHFQYIIGNPPWGYEFSDTDKEVLRKKYSATSKKNIESYDIFIERALSNLAINGQLSFVLPEAVLNVKAHTDIRRIILQSNSIKYLEFLGNVFDGVQCPCIILQIIHTNKPFSTIGLTVNDGKQTFNITTKRPVTSECFSFLTSDTEYKILEKIKNLNNTSFLANNADFALGIVTGNNKKYISTEKTNNNEMILKGSDISKYHINQTDNYIIFNPENFQQIAPIEIYRAPEKLLYRFISSQLVFAYDDKQTLSLNSCNIVIPKLDGLKIKYILAILNSRVAQFLYKKEFNSIKVLRSHIENIPIPMVSEKIQNKIILATEPLIQGVPLEKAQEIYEQLDNMIFEIFQLTPQEQAIIKSAVDGENKFLT